MMITDKERRELCAWIKDEHNAHDNPWYIADERGAPLDFITAMRTVNDLCEQYDQGLYPTP